MHKPPVFNVGDTVGDYQIVSRIRSGGMATLYLGRRSGPAGFEREVALKVVHPHLATEPRYIEMFLDEARLAARIDHPNVVHIHDVGEAHSTLFLVMEYVQGVSLWQVERALDRLNRSLPIDLAVYLAIAVADGLHAAHETTAPDGRALDVVHRDVSPQNVLIATRGHIKLIDFGIAKARGRLQETVGANLKGKIRYMAPEQALGRTVDRRTDVYSLGIVLWEMLTRRRFYASIDAMSLMEHVRSPTIVAPSLFNPSVTPALDAVVLAALATDPAQRISSAYELRARLAEAVPSALAIDASHMARFIAEVLQSDPAAHAETPSIAPEAPSEASPLAPPLIDEPVSIPALTTATISASISAQVEAPPAFGTPGAAFEIDTDQDSSPSPLVLPAVEIPAPMPSSVRTVVLPSASHRAQTPWVKWALFAGLAVFAAGIGVTIGTRNAPEPAAPVAASQPPPPRPVAAADPLVVEDPPPLPAPEADLTRPSIAQPLAPSPLAPVAPVAPRPSVRVAAPVRPIAARPALARPAVVRPTVVRPAVVRPAVVARPIAPMILPTPVIAQPTGRPVTPTNARPIETTQPLRPNAHGNSNVPIVETDPF